MEPELDEHYLLYDGEEHGPYTLEQLKEFWLEKTVPLDTLYVRRGMPQVCPLEQVINLIIAYKKPEPPPPPRPPSTVERTVKYFILGTLLLLSTTFTLHGIKTILYPSREPTVILRAEVSVSPVQLKLRNADNFTWANKLIRLNDDQPGSFQYRILSLEPGKTVTVPLVSFVDAGGRHFQPWNQTVTSVWLGTEHDFHRMTIWRQ